MTVTVKDIPHVTGFTVSNTDQELEGIPVEDGRTYRVMFGDDVYVSYMVEEGYTSQTANPLVFPGVESGVTIDTGSIEIVKYIPYRAWNETTRLMEDYECTDYTIVTGDTGVFENERWYVVTGRVERGTITVNGAAHLILCDGAMLKAAGGMLRAGVCVNSGRSLTIYGQTLGTGELVANGGHQASGIGGNNQIGGGTVTISGGTVTAQGGQAAAGIGGGFDGAGGTAGARS